MKILVVAPQPVFTPRGTPFSVYYRALAMAKLGAEIDLLTYGSGQDVDIPRARTIRIPRFQFLEPVPIGPSWQKLLLDLCMIAWTAGLLLRYRYPVVHAHEEAVFWCRWLKPVFRFRLIYDMHSSLPQQLRNFEFTRSRLLIGLFEALEDSCLKASSAVVTVCPDLREQVLAAGVLPDRHIMIENSTLEDVRLKASQPATSSDRSIRSIQFGLEHPVIFYAGTFEVYQGVNILIEAFAQVVRKLPTARLLMVGGTEKQVAEARLLSASFDLGDTCVITGQVSHAEVIDYLQYIDVLVSPRIQGTNTPMKVYEQLASGRPLVATRIWSHTQVLDDSVCFLVEPTAESIAEGLMTALTDTTASAERARNAKALFERQYAPHVYDEKIRRLLKIVA